ncbi:MAG: diguanylate cyclase [Thermodesulfobacteriota bacterium]
MSILITDDSKSFRSLLERILKKEGYVSLLLAGSAEEAFTILGASDDGGDSYTDVDLILMDVVMPGIDGIEAVRRIKECPHLRDIPIIMLSGAEDTESLERAFEVGASDYVTKPPNRVELLVRIRSALTLKKETDRRKNHAEELLHVSEQLKAANERLKRISSTDGLTGVANRRSFDQYLTRMWSMGKREKRSVALLLLDIDYFKLYNDKHGHLAGDDCLKRIAAMITRTVKRPTDLVARYGGEEFAVIMPETKLKGAAFMAEKIRGAVSGMRLPHEADGAGTHVTVSIGVAAVVPGRGAKQEEIIAAADAALYRAKDEGRNRVETV